MFKYYYWPYIFWNLTIVKQRLFYFGQTENLASVNVNLGPLAAHNKVAVKNVGVWFDRELKFDKQINNVVKSCFF